MTAPGALREEIAGLLSTMEFNPSKCHPTQCLEMADALLARLRPAWEAREKQFQEDWMENFSQYEDKLKKLGYTGEDPMPVIVNLPSGIDDQGQRGPARTQDSYEAEINALRADLQRLEHTRQTLVDQCAREFEQKVALRADLETTINQRDHAVEDLRACAEALEAIIYASDQCRGHRDCEHNMEPWTKARAALARPGVQEARE